MKNFLNLVFIFFIIISPIDGYSEDNIVKSKVFIEQLGQKVMGKVSNPKITDTQRHTNFRDIYLSSFDSYYISKFVLGRHWKSLDENLQKRFINTFNDYVVATYAPKFKGWGGKVKALNSTLNKNYYNVLTSIINEKGPILNLQWKIYLNKNNKFKILDVNIDGVSMLVTQRAEFSAVIKNNPKGVSGLIEAMERKTKSSGS
tara:strand:- start:83 stop:688 length:606 start_codon:yes stop_codon:yes gene_type:complete